MAKLVACFLSCSLDCSHLGILLILSTLIVLDASWLTCWFACVVRCQVRSGVRSGHQQTQSFRRLYYFRTSVWSDILDADLIKDKFLEGHRDTSLGEKRAGTWKRGTRYLVKRKGRGTWETGTRLLVKREGRGNWETGTRFLMKRKGRGPGRQRHVSWWKGRVGGPGRQGHVSWWKRRDGGPLYSNVCNTWVCIVENRNKRKKS